VGRNLRVQFVYPQPRREVLDDIAAGRAPDTLLHGMNHMHAFGVDANVHDPRLWRREMGNRAFATLAWYLREIAVAWELPEADAVCTTMSRFFPLADRVHGRRAVLLNMALQGELGRASPAKRRLLVAGLRSSAAVVCFAESQRERTLELSGLDPARVHTALLGVDQGFYEPAGYDPEGPVLAVGFDVARDYATFTRAIADLPREVVVVARRRNLEGIDVPRNVRFEPDASFSELRDLYARAACVVVPTRGDGFMFGGDTSGATVLLEAMAMAKPVVITERRWVGDYVRDGESARIVPSEQPGPLREAIDELLADPALSARLGEGALRRVRARHTTRAFGERLAGVIRGCVEPASAPKAASPAPQPPAAATPPAPRG
jgi:glycosyltransferase involved in cell wall biosynthesis